MYKLFQFFLVVFSSITFGCSLAAPAVESAEIYGVPDDIDISGEGLSSYIESGTTLITTANVNFRKGPSTSYGILKVLAEGTTVVAVKSGSPTSSFYQVKQAGTVGWVHGSYLKVYNLSNDGNELSNDGNELRKRIVSRAQSAVGFSYWWGHGRWRGEGPNNSTKGYCSGSCPSCSHSGSYGADCSGMVAKAWEVPSYNSELTDDEHPYSTSSFNGTSSLWKTVSRGSMLEGDALVYNNGSSGHIMIYRSGDGWGSLWSYECKGCSAGCVYNLRTVSSSYKGIRKTGI